MLVSYFADPLQFVDAPLVWMIWLVPLENQLCSILVLFQFHYIVSYVES
jgi:hypothetical protein